MKLDRLLAIVMLLLNRKQMSAKELAEYFEVSQRTIYRDIESITQAGIPIVSYMGTDGGFGIMENYKLKKNFLTEDEISSILTALKSIDTTIGNRQVSSTLEKMKGMLPDEALSSDGARSFPIHIDYSSWNNGGAEKERLRLLNRAIDEKRAVSFEYVNIKGEDTLRTVEPLSLILKDFAWYMHGYCRIKDDYRLFKVRRMSNISVTNDFFLREALPIDELNYREEWCDNKPQLNIILKFSSDAKVRIIDCFHRDQIRFNDDGSGTVNFTFPEDDWLFELILGLGSKIEVLEPLHLRQTVKAKALEIAQLY